MNLTGIHALLLESVRLLEFDGLVECNWIVWSSVSSTLIVCTRNITACYGCLCQSSPAPFNICRVFRIRIAVRVIIRVARFVRRQMDSDSNPCCCHLPQSRHCQTTYLSPLKVVYQSVNVYKYWKPYDIRKLIAKSTILQHLCIPSDRGGSLWPVDVSDAVSTTCMACSLQHRLPLRINITCLTAVRVSVADSGLATSMPASTSTFAYSAVPRYPADASIEGCIFTSLAHAQYAWMTYISVSDVRGRQHVKSLQLEGLWESCKLPQWGLGQSPSQNQNSVLFVAAEYIRTLSNLESISTVIYVAPNNDLWVSLAVTNSCRAACKSVASMQYLWICKIETAFRHCAVVVDR